MVLTMKLIYKHLLRQLVKDKIFLALLLLLTVLTSFSFIDIYFPVMCAGFIITVFPSIMLAESIQKSLSISTDDFMPFGCNSLVIAAAFAAICLIYCGVTKSFNFGIRRVTAKGEFSDIVYAE